jgi:serine/threonine-protein kinase
MEKQPRHERIERLFHEALALDPSERSDFLKRSCGSDPALIAEVQSLLVEHERTGSFISSPAYEMQSELLVPPEHLLEGKSLGHYGIQKRIGAGGMGEVYQAHDETLDREVALKVLPTATFRDETARARLIREARSAAALNHPHICTIHEVGEAEGLAYIAMELVHGQSLSARLAKGALPTGEVLRYSVQLADALAHAHERGVVHRDLKSANVIITPEGRAKVLDFGLAKRVTAEELDEATRTQVSLTQPGSVVGTLAYMAPEQLRGRTADARSDIWAMGIVVYEMAAGSQPFRGQTGFELSSAILNQSPLPLPAAVPTELKALIGRCLEKDPARRYQRASEVREALEAIQTGTTSSWETLRYQFGRHPGWTLAGTFLILALLLAGLNPGGLRDRLLEPIAGARIKSLVVIPLTNQSGDPAQEHLADGVTEALIAELSKILKVTSRTSAMQYKGTKKPLRQIAGELGVDGAIEGGILKEGDQVRVTIQLIDARTDKSLWAQSFDREARGILSLQREVVLAIANEVKVKLSPQAEKALLASARPVNPEAYEAYLKGRISWYKQTPQEVDRALQYFQFASEKDPNFPLAYLGMGYVFAYYASVGLMPPGEAGQKLLEAVRKARVLDETLAEAHEGEADYKFYYDWDWAGAEKEYKRAVELKPNSAEMRLYYWEFLAAMKRLRESEEQVNRLLELDPLNSYVQMIYGMFLLSAHRFDEAIAQFQKILTSEADFGPAHLGIWQAYNHKGMAKHALAAAQTYFTKWGDEEMAKLLAGAKSDYRGAMRLVADKLAARFEQTYVLPTHVAMVYGYAGEKQRVLDWLEKAFQQRETGLVKLQIDPDWDLVRDEPRFRELLRKMNFPPS